MKKIIYSFLVILGMLAIPACEKYTDITPKGKNMLDRVSDLDLLMNYEYTGQGFDFMPMSVLVNDMYPQVVNVPNLINGTVKNLNYALVTYDKTIDRKALATTDAIYERLYPIITNVSNIVLAKADAANGDQALAKQLKAEAYIIRAYIHYMLVNIYSKAYNPATAATDGGIPYVDKIDFGELNAKSSVKEVYEKMVSDVDAAFALNALPDQPKNSMRVGKGFAYGVKARLLLTLRDYAGALVAANTGLTYNSVLEDHRPFLPVNKGGSALAVSRIGLTAPDNLFYARIGQNFFPTINFPSLEIVSNYYEVGNIIKDYTTTYNAMYGTIYSGISGVLLWIAMYEGNSAGMTTSDLYMIKAECLARTGKYSEAMDVINYVRQRRVYPYVPHIATAEAEVMAELKKTARIEFLFTWRNFVDIKRWNAEPTYAQTITRTVNGTTYTLTPDSELWIFPFPQSATNYNPLLTQNY